MLYLFDQDDKFLSLLVKETGLVDAWFKDYQNHIIDEPFVFKIKSSSPKLKYIEAENQVAFYDRDGNLRLMRMKQLYEETSQEESVIRVVCEPSYLELYDHFIEDKRYVDKTAKNALDGALQGSRFIGEVTVELGLATDSFYWIDGIGAVFKILETWGGALKDTIKLDANNEIIERKIMIVQRLGADNGLIVEPDFNAESIERKTLSYVETALWGQGSSLEITDDDDEHTGGYTRYITFEDVVWSKAKGDPVDKPKGQKWVGDPIALNEFGYLHNGVRKHRFGHFSNQDYETPEELLMATWLELQERKLKEIIHEASITAGDKIVSLGDTVTILNRNYNKPIELQSQITGLEYDPLRPKDEVTIIIGKYIDMNEDPLQKDVDDLKDVVHKPRPTKPITDESFPDIKPGIPINIIAEGAFQFIQLYWEYDSAVYISHYEVYGSQVKDFIPDSQHLLWRGKVSAFAHEVDTDELWYYRIRAVNTRGTASDYSVQVSASTVRIISDDILFGSIIADHLSSNLDIADKLAQNTIDAINRGPMLEIEYTKEQITEAENRLLGQLNTEIGDVNASIVNLNDVASNLQNRANVTDDLLSQHGGNFIRFEQDINDIDGRISTTINKVESIDGTVKSHGLELITQADLISAKLDSLEYGRDKDGIINRIESNELDIQATARGLDLRVTKEEFEALEIGGRNFVQNSFPYTTELWRYSQFSNDGDYAISKGELFIENGSNSWKQWQIHSEQGADVLNGVVGGEEYTLSVEVRKLSSAFTGLVKVALRYNLDDSTTEPVAVEIDNNKLVQNEWVKFSITGIVPQSVIDSSIYSRIIAYFGGVGKLGFRKIQLEKGNKSTDWSPAPEDVDGAISSVSNRVTTTEATLKVHADQILAKVEKNDVYTRTDVDSKLGNKVETTVYNNKISALDITINGISGQVSNTTAEVNALTGEVTNAKSQIASLDVKANQVDIRVSDIRNDLTSTQGQMAAINIKADGIIHTVESIQIGGRNFAQNGFPYDTSHWYFSQANVSGSSSISEGELRITNDDNGWKQWQIQTDRGATALNEIMGDQIYTLSFEVKKISSVVTGSLPISLRYNPSGTNPISISINANELTDKWVKFSVTGTVPQSLIDSSSFSRIITMFNGTGTVGFRKIQLEKGNKASDYQNAPEDTDARMTKSESKITQLSDEVDIKVDKNGVVASINLSSEGVRINGNRHHITGQTLIDDAVIGTLALANGSVTNLKIGTGAVDTLQVKDGAINNAKIANLNADKINAGAIRGIDIYGAKFRSSSGTDWMEIVGGNVHLNQANGRYVKINPDGLFGYNANGSLRFKADASLVMSAALGTANSNVYLAPVNWGEVRVVSYDSIPGGGAATDYTYRPIRAQSFIAPPMANAYIGTDGELRVTNAGTDGIYRDVRANGVYANFLDGRGTSEHIYIRPRLATGEVRITTTGSTGAYRDLRARDGAFRMIGLSTSFTGSTHFYVTTAGNGEVRFVARADTTAYRPVRASSFPTGTSLRENKTDIEAFEESALDTLRNITPYLYRIKGDEGNPYKQLGLMVDETPRYLHGESGDSMEMYALGTFALKGVKELDTKVIKIEDRLDVKDLEIQYLRQKIEQLEEKMTA